MTRKIYSSMTMDIKFKLNNEKTIIVKGSNTNKERDQKGLIIMKNDDKPHVMPIEDIDAELLLELYSNNPLFKNGRIWLDEKTIEEIIENEVKLEKSGIKNVRGIKSKPII